LHEENRKRELDGMLGPLKEFKLRNGSILTYNQEDEFKIEGTTPPVKPVWKWMLEK
jgi:predicted AAA+ superfamily ATPase